jgi:hypothetical protein
MQKQQEEQQQELWKLNTRDRQGVTTTSEIIHCSGGESRKKFVTKLIMQHIYPMMMTSKSLKILQKNE